MTRHFLCACTPAVPWPAGSIGNADADPPLSDARRLYWPCADCETDAAPIAGGLFSDPRDPQSVLYLTKPRARVFRALFCPSCYAARYQAGINESEAPE